jgi:DNA-binding transcriptional ArsR family regulator
VSELDPVIHQPTRLRLVMLLSGLDTADFNFLLSTLSLTKGNLSSHMKQLEQAGYVEVSKTFKGRIPHTTYRITSLGRSRLDGYWQAIDEIRQSA